MHKINISNKNIYTDLILELNKEEIKEKIIDKYNNIKVLKSTNHTTITYNDITDKDNYMKVQNTLITELKKYIKISNKDIILVVGLGNYNSTPDSLGPNTINNILVTRYLYLLGDVEEGYSNVSSFTPNVMANTGIETTKIIKSIVKEIKATKLIIIDSLKTNSIDRLLKTIQITNQGITPGSGLNNNYKEISKKTMNIDVIAIGIPTVVDIRCINNKLDNLIVTPNNIDYLIDKLSILLGNSINICLHKNFIRQNNK